MAVMIAVRDETNETICKIIDMRLKKKGVKDSKARIVAEAVAKFQKIVSDEK